MSYPDSVRYLYALGNELKVGAKFGLDRMQVLLRALGHPERSVTIIHVAGTNGKGSTCAMIAAACRAEGLRTGLYTSPHLVSPTERIDVNGLPVSEGRFAELFDVVHRKAEELVSSGHIDEHPTYFETVTAMALLAFASETEIAVIEVGLGGRLDATNVVHPKLTVITPVHFDHEAFLGNTIALIAAEKAGILKPDVPLILAPQSSEAEAVILERAFELNCPVRRAADARLTNLHLTPYRATFELDGERYECGLAGAHQVQNAVTAILAGRAIGLSHEAIREGTSAARWPGRLEYVSRDPDFVLDGAHNPSGAHALAMYIREFCSERPVWIVYGAMRDKAIDEVATQLFPLADRLILTAPDFPRALRPESILDIASHPNATIAPSVPDAVNAARNASAEAIVFFTGSLFIVGEARAVICDPT